MKIQIRSPGDAIFHLKEAEKIMREVNSNDQLGVNKQLLAVISLRNRTLDKRAVALTNEKAAQGPSLEKR